MCIDVRAATMNKDDTPMEICPCMCTYIYTHVSTRTRVDQVAIIGSGTMLWRAKAKGMAKCGEES